MWYTLSIFDDVCTRLGGRPHLGAVRSQIGPQTRVSDCTCYTILCFVVHVELVARIFVVYAGSFVDCIALSSCQIFFLHERESVQV